MRYSAPGFRAGVRPVTDQITARLSFLVSGLALAWLLWSGVYSTRPFIFSLGVGSCLFVLWLSMRMRRTAEVGESPVPGLGFSLPYAEMDLCLYAHDHGVDAAEVAAVIGLSPEQCERVYRDIKSKRRATGSGTRSETSPPKVAISFTPLEERKEYCGDAIK